MKPYSDVGFTLVEVMVALVAGAILTAAAYQMLTNQLRVYEVQEQTVTMQRDARSAIEFICQELRQAGYGVDEDGDVFVSLTNNNQDADFAIPTTDAISFVANTQESSIIAGDAPAVAEALLVQPAPNAAREFRVSKDYEDPYVILDWNRRLVPNIATDLKIETVSYNFNQYTQLGFTCALGADVQAGYILTRRPTTTTYRLRRDDYTNRPVLDRVLGPVANNDYTPLIDDIEDFQLVYAVDNDGDNEIDVDADGLVIWSVDSDGDGRLDTRVQDDGSTASLTTTTAISGNSFECRIRAVRVSILVRTERENPDHRFRSQYSRPALEDRAAADSDDGFRRYLLQRVVKFRNLGMG